MKCSYQVPQIWLIFSVFLIKSLPDRPNSFSSNCISETNTVLLTCLNTFRIPYKSKPFLKKANWNSFMLFFFVSLLSPKSFSKWMLRHWESQVLEGTKFLKLPERLISFESLYFGRSSTTHCSKCQDLSHFTWDGGEPGLSFQEWFPACLFIEHNVLLYQKVKLG